ncbi:MAG TPA: hypothetical protein VN736_08165 [Candidatus Limnocylindrales bacterium]|nr:hypothetical protein [Candidatus Limnocylindrales bacterium]
MRVRFERGKRQFGVTQILTVAVKGSGDRGKKQLEKAITRFPNIISFDASEA